MSPSLTLYFVVEPPDYLYMSCHLAASIRKYMAPDVVLIGYCPASRWDEMDPCAVEVLRRLRVEIKPIETAGKFDPPYPHGNKILAALEPKDTDFAAFLDSDMLFMRDCTVDELVQPGAVGVVPSTSMRWSDQSIWPRLYGAFGLEVPDERITMTRDKRQEVAPYFNAGLLVIDEQYRNAEGQRFAEIWMETAQTIDALPDIDNRRPYLDQMSMPIAILRAGMSWALLPERYNYSIGGNLRGKPLPDDVPTILHYRGRNVLHDAGLGKVADGFLAEQVGTQRVRWIFKVPPPPGIEAVEPPQKPKAASDQAPAKDETAAATPVQPEQQAEAPRSPRPQQPDPSRAGLAAVTMERGDHLFLQRWVDYYGALTGRENLYILRHGPDPEIDRIAAGANIVNVPVCDDMAGFDRRRWGALSAFASGLTLYYNWVLCNDVDELVAPDPATGQNLIEYLDGLFERGLAASVISPFAVEIVHTPATEPDPITPGAPLLSVRRNFRINSNYAKPCLIRRRVRFSIGGHGSDTQDVRLDPQLWLFHLRYMDDAISTERLQRRQAFVAEKAASPEDAARSSSTWAQGTSSFERLREMTPVAEQAEFPEVIERMVSGRQQASSGNWFFGAVRSRELYRLPERFSKLF